MTSGCRRAEGSAPSSAVHSGPIAIAYVENLTWVDTPDKLFQDLLSETVTRTTNRVVLDPRQSSLDPGVTITGNLSRFGYDAQERMVVVRYDGAMTRGGATAVTTRRFEAREPADGTASTVAPAINAAANRVAMEVAQWWGADRLGERFAGCSTRPHKACVLMIDPFNAHNCARRGSNRFLGRARKCRRRPCGLIR